MSMTANTRPNDRSDDAYGARRFIRLRLTKGVVFLGLIAVSLMRWRGIFILFDLAL
jgi:hypothetical protein